MESDNIILTRNEWVRRNVKKVIFCVLDRNGQRVIKVVLAENRGELRALRGAGMVKWQRCLAVVYIQIALLLRIKKRNVLGSIQGSLVG